MTKKSFTDAVNPAAMFISSAQPEAAQQPESHTLKATDAPEGYKVNPAFVETKSKRVNLLMQPSLLEKVKEAAKAEGISVNEFIHRTLEKATREA